MKQDVAKFVRACESCQRHRGQVGRAPMGHIPSPRKPFMLVAMDVIGPFKPTRRKNRFIIVMVCHFTRYPVARAVPEATAGRIKDFCQEVWSQFGYPQAVLTDQGQNFMSNELAEFYKIMGVQKLRTTPYHPQGNGLCERMNQTLKGLLRTDIGEIAKDWDQRLPHALLSIRESVNRSTGFSPAQLLFGRNIRGPI